jgi:hypothetical protein
LEVDPLKQGKAFFFEKKKQKAFVCAIADFSRNGTRQHKQKLFGRPQCA